MKVGYLSLSHASGIRPDVLGRELEQRGFDSIWFPEHTNIPTSRASAYPGGGELPPGYFTMMNPFVAAMAAAMATTRLTVATGICLVLQHEVIDLAKTIATLDVLSGGRVLLGVGVGWNAEELANARPDVPFKSRFSAAEERIAALRTIWSQEKPSFDGRWDRFTETTIEPKPVRGSVPIALGNAGPVGISHAARYADEWCPIDASLLNEKGRPDVQAGVEYFRRLAAEAGRSDPEAIPISVFCWTLPPPARLEQYRAAGVQRVVATPPTMALHDDDATLRHLDKWHDSIVQFG